MKESECSELLCFLVMSVAPWLQVWGATVGLIGGVRLFSGSDKTANPVCCTCHVLSPSLEIALIINQ